MPSRTVLERTAGTISSNGRESEEGEEVEEEEGRRWRREREICRRAAEREVKCDSDKLGSRRRKGITGNESEEERVGGKIFLTAVPVA